MSRFLKSRNEIRSKNRHSSGILVFPSLNNSQYISSTDVDVDKLIAGLAADTL
jgi:hypothetical protein